MKVPYITKSAVLLNRLRCRRIVWQLLACVAIAGIAFNFFRDPGGSFPDDSPDDEATLSDAIGFTPATDQSMDIVLRGWPKNVPTVPWAPFGGEGDLIVPLHPQSQWIGGPYINISDDGDSRFEAHCHSMIRVSQKGIFAGRKIELLGDSLNSPEIVASVIRDDQYETLTLTISEGVKPFDSRGLEAFVEVIESRLSPFADGTPLPPSDKWIVLNAHHHARQP